MRAIVFTYLTLVACGSVTSRPYIDGGDGSPNEAGSDAPPLRPASLSASPTTGTDFGDVVLGQSTKASYMVTNDGDLPTAPIAIAVGDGTIGFAITDDTCGGQTLDHQQTCSFTVAFAPTAVGRAMTTVHVTAAPNAELARDVAGNGLTPGAVSIIEPGFEFGALSVDVSPASHTFVIQNTGQIAIGAPSATLGGSNATSYGIASTTCIQMLAPGAECQVVVRFDPSTVGDKPASLTVTSSPGGSDSATLSGTGTAHVTISKAGTGAGTVRSNQTGIDCGTSCSSDFSASPVTLNATPATGSTFDGWSNDCTGTGSCSLDLTRARMVTATFSAITPRLAVTIAGNGVGTVTSSPAGISCGSTCTATFPFSATVTLTATPQTGSTFTGWSGACSGTTICTVTMDQAQSVTATFTLDRHSLTWASSGNGAGSVTPSPSGTANCGASCATYDFNTSVTLTATPATGSAFTGWTGACTGTTACTVTMTQDRSVTAQFTLLTHQLTTSVTGSGAISCGGSPCATSYNHGMQLSLVATPATGWRFSSWSGACAGVTGSTCSLTITADTTVGATFVQDTRDLALMTVGSGTITPSPAGASCGAGCFRYSFGTAVTLTATPGTGNSFAGWTGCSSNSSLCTVTMDQPHSVTATFTVNLVPLTAQAPVGGSIGSTPAGINCGTACNTTFPFGTQVTLSANPTAGWSFSSWGGNAPCSASSSCVFNMPASAVTASAVFNPSLSVTIGGGNSTGSVTSSPGGINCSSGTCQGTFTFNSQVTLTASPAASSHVTWGGACSGIASTCTVRMNQLQSVTARFDLNVFTLTVNLGGDASGTVTGSGITCPGTCSNTYTQDTIVTLTATPGSGAEFNGWSGACSGTGATCTVTMSQAQSVGAAFNHTSYTITLHVVKDRSSGAGPGGYTVNGCASGVGATGNTCTFTFQRGATFQFVASPPSNFAFETGPDWTGCDSIDSQAHCLGTALSSRQITVVGSTSTSM